MGYVLPGWLDEILDFIGINWPNVDEDDYREMADAMREFADTFEGHGGEAHAAVSRILASSEGYAVDALQEHWGKVKGSCLDKVPEVSRLFATACDVVADIIYGMKVKAEVELGAMAASIGISIGLAVVTGGLSALVGAAETAAMREVIRRIIKEAEEEIVSRLMAEVTEPVTAKLEKMTEDLILDVADDAIHLPPGEGGGGGGTGGGAGGGAGGGHGGGRGGMSLDSADGGGGTGGGGGRVRIDPDEFDNGAEKLSRHGSDLHTDSLAPLGRAKGAFGRARGRDPFTQAFDSVLHGALNGSEKALKKVAEHVGEGVPGGVRAMAKRHRDNERSIADSMRGITSRSDGKGPDSGGARGGTKRWERAGAKVKLAAAQLSQKARAARCKLFGGDPIDMATGEMFLAQTDLELPGVLPLTIERTHISGYRHGLFFGPSWASTLDERLERGDGGIWWHRTDGSSLMYHREPDMLGDQVWPLGGERIPLTCVMEGTGYALAVADPVRGLTRHFRGAPDAEAGTWWLAEIEDRNGNGISIDREAAGVPTAVRHDGGYHVEVACEDGLVSAISLRTPGGPVRVKSYTHDAERNLTGVLNSSGLPLQFAYDAEHRITSWTDRNGSAFQYVYDEAGRVIQTVGPDGYLSARLDYDRAERTTRYTDSLGAVTVYRTNERGQVIAETDPLGHTLHSEWDSHDNLLLSTDALGNTTRFEWDENATDLVAVHHPDGTRTSIAYDPRTHLPRETRLPEGAVWRHEYDARGNLTAHTAPDGSTTRLTHAPTGAVQTLTDPLGQTSTVETGPTGVITAVTDPLGQRIACTRDAFGRSLILTDPSGATTTMEWTVEGEPARRTAADGTVESWTWDGEGNCLTFTDANGGRTECTYGHFDQIASRTTPDGARYSFSYDTELRLTQVTSPGNLAWTYAYDAAGRLTSETDFDGRTTHLRYDAVDRLIARTTPMGETISFELDAMGRTLSKDAAGTVTSYTHDAAGRLLTASAPTSDLEITYDRLGRITEETVEGRTTAFTYDAAGRRTSRTTPSGATTTLTYDAVGNRTGLELGGHTLAFTHDPSGRELTRTLGAAAHTRITSAWDHAGRLTRRTLAAGTHTLRDRSHAYRADSYLEALTEQISGVTQRVSLDPVGRPLGLTTGAHRETYAYDRQGNQTRADWDHPAADPHAAGERTYSGTRLMTAGRVSYSHDAAGRLVERRKTRISRKPDVWHYAYDAEDRLTSCTTPDGTVWHYRYDPLGRRTAKYRPAEDGEGATEEISFSWDLVSLAEQTDASTGVTVTWEHEGHQPIAQHERRSMTQEEFDSRFFAIVTDLVGTPTELVDETGAVAWHTQSTCWGTTAWNADAGAYTPLRFPGQYADPETGLHYNYFRHYDPETARFTSPDPLGLEPAPNPYAYVLNPMAWIDLLGLLTCKQNAKILRDNMAAEGRAPGPGQAAAHIVPSGGQQGHWAPGARARGLLQQYGVDINDAANGIPLNHPTPHNYTHRGAYLQRLDTHLQTTVGRLQAMGHSNQTIANTLRSELRRIGTHVQSELSTGQPGPSAHWTA
jgi:RHS repeat-associated protein